MSARRGEDFTSAQSLPPSVPHSRRKVEHDVTMSFPGEIEIAALTMQKIMHAVLPGSAQEPVLPRSGWSYTGRLLGIVVELRLSVLQLLVTVHLGSPGHQSTQSRQREA